MNAPTISLTVKRGMVEHRVDVDAEYVARVIVRTVDEAGGKPSHVIGAAIRESCGDDSLVTWTAVLDGLARAYVAQIEAARARAEDAA